MAYHNKALEGLALPEEGEAVVARWALYWVEAEGNKAAFHGRILGLAQLKEEGRS